MKLVEIASPVFYVEFTGRASVPTNEDPEEFVQEVRTGDQFTFGEIYLMTDEVKLNHIQRVRGGFVIDVSVKGTVRMPPGTSPSALHKMTPSIFGQRILVDKVVARPTPTNNSNIWNESVDTKLTDEDVNMLVSARQSGTPKWEEIADILGDKLQEIFSNAGELPYGVMKARDADPYQWLVEKLETMSELEFAQMIKDNSTSDPRIRMGGKRPQATLKPMGG